MFGLKDLDILQHHENFTGGVLMSIFEHGFCEPEECNDCFTNDRLSAPNDDLPLDTSGSNLADCYMHGFGLNIEAVRQIWAESSSQIDNSGVSRVISDPTVTSVRNSIFFGEAAL